MEKMQPDQPQRTMRVAYRLRGPLDADQLERAFRSVIARHDALRMSFAETSAGLRYVVHDQVEWCLIREPAVSGAGGPLPPELLRDLDTELESRFDRSEAPLMRARLWRLGTEDWLLCIKLDHMVADVASLNVLSTEVSRAYQGEVFPVPAPSFTTWIDEQARYLEGPDAAADREYWDSVLGSRPAGWETSLPDFGLSEPAGDSVEEQERPLTADLSKLANQFGRDHRMTPYMVILSALMLCIAQRTGDSDVCVMGSTANRSRELADLIGWCAHGVAYRVDASSARTPAELARRVRDCCLQVLRHQRYSLLRWRLDNAPAEHGQRISRPYVFLHPVTDYYRPPTFAGLATEVVKGALAPDPCLGVQLRRRPSGEMLLHVHYGGFGYDRDRAARFLGDLEESLTLMIQQPDGKLTGLPGWPS